MKVRRTYVNEAMEGKNTPLRRWLIQDKCMNDATWSSQNSQEKTSRRRTSLTQFSLNLSWVTFLQIPNLNLHEYNTSIYSVRGLKLKWENSNEKHLNLVPNTCHNGGVTWFLSLAPPKTTPTPSFYVTWKVWLIFVH